MKILNVWKILLIALSMMGTVHADWAWKVVDENDLWVPPVIEKLSPNMDRDYSHGIAFSMCDGSNTIGFESTMYTPA